MLEMAKEAGVDLKNEVMLQEFKLLQIQNLEDVRRKRLGQKPLSKEEIEDQRAKLRQEMDERRAEQTTCTITENLSKPKSV